LGTTFVIAEIVSASICHSDMANCDYSNKISFYHHPLFLNIVFLISTEICLFIFESCDLYFFSIFDVFLMYANQLLGQLHKLGHYVVKTVS